MRLGYIDWMRGLACLLMFQTHCYDSWLSPAARRSTFFVWSQLVGTLPAPLFLFLAGVSFAFLTEKLRRSGLADSAIAHTTIARGAEIFGIGLLFRLQLFLFNWRWSPWSDLLRVDVLNIIGLSLVVLGMACWIASWLSKIVPPVWAVRPRDVTMGLALFFAGAISLVTPPLWTTHRPNWLPWPLESYVNGVHIFSEPQTYLFPIFPWAGFAFAGLAVGCFLLAGWSKRHEAAVFVALAALGVCLIAMGRWLDHWPRQVYAVYSFWTTSPEFFLIRIGLMLIILFGSYAWCRWGLQKWGFSPVVSLGQASLLVYWVHIEFVYDRLNVLPSRVNTIRVATAGLVFISLFMLVLSILRGYLKGRGPDLGTWIRQHLSSGRHEPAKAAAR